MIKPSYVYQVDTWRRVVGYKKCDAIAKKAPRCKVVYELLEILATTYSVSRGRVRNNPTTWWNVLNTRLHRCRFLLEEVPDGEEGDT